MKDKTIAAILAFFGGIIGLQRFYLGQKGLGMAHLFFFVLAMSAGPSPFTVLLISLAMIFGIIDAMSYLSMDPREFDLKYNQSLAPTSTGMSRYPPSQQKQGTMTDRERRFQERQRQRAERERERERQDRARFNQRPPEPTPTTVVHQDPGRADRERGVQYFREYEYEAAISAFRRALELNSRDVATHFNIACAYSVEEEADRAFYHLDRAVALGFDDFTRIRTHDSLAHLRVQRAYPGFASNQFRLATVSEQPLENQADPIAATDAPPLDTTSPIHDELLEQLQRLAALREKGLLTELEFSAQKRRLLG